MKFGDLIKGLMESRDKDGHKIISVRRNEFAYKLLNAAGLLKHKKTDVDSVDKQIEEEEKWIDRVGKWIDRKVPDNISSYFPEGKINEPKTSEYFRSHTEEHWKIVQKTLSSRNAAGSFNCSNEDSAVFYKCLVDELVRSLRLPSSKEPANDIPMDKEAPVLSAASLSSLNNNESEFTSRIRGIFEQAVQDYRMEDFIRYDSTVSLDDNLLDRADNFLKTIDTDIIDAYKQSHGETLIYKKLMEFYHELEGYVRCLRLGFISYSPSYIRDIRRNTIKNLYYGICPYETCFEYRDSLQEMRDPIFKRKDED